MRRGALDEDELLAEEEQFLRGQSAPAATVKRVARPAPAPAVPAAPSVPQPPRDVVQLDLPFFHGAGTSPILSEIREKLSGPGTVVRAPQVKQAAFPRAVHRSAGVVRRSDDRGACTCVCLRWTGECSPWVGKPPPLLLPL